MPGRRFSDCSRACVLLSATLLLPGCLLTRVYSFKYQFCDYDRNFELRIDQEARLLMRNPVLYASDVVWLLGELPTRSNNRNGALEMVYVVEKDVDAADPAYSIPVSLRFSRRGGRYRLEEGIIHQNLTTVLSPALIANTVKHTCRSKPDWLSRSVDVDLREISGDDLPSRTDIQAALGPPQASSVAGRRIEYRYRLQDAGPDSERTHAVAWFGPDGEKIERLHLRYFRYELDADFVAKKARIRVRL